MTDNKQATLADVAAVAGVSKMTASRALRGAADVSASSKEKVIAAARQIGYVGNPLAQSLSSQRSDLIGVVVPGLSNVVFAEVLAGIASGITGSGVQPVFGTTDYDPDKEYDILCGMLSWKPAGLIVTGLDQPDKTRALLAQADVPVVQIMDLDGTAIDACVGLSHDAAGHAMGQSLLQAGRRKFGYVGCYPKGDTRAQKRLNGFQRALAENGLGFQATVQEDGLSSTGDGRRMTAALLDQDAALDCIYFSNDDVALGGAFHCLSAGIDVPGQVLLAGFNGLEFLQALPISIATSYTQRYEIGAEAARLVISRRNAPQEASPKRVAFSARVDLGR